MITLLVGPKKEQLIAHEHRLIKTSDFFRAALKKEWKEGQTHVVKLPEERIKDTRHYLEFIYENTLPSGAIESGSELQKGGMFGVLCDLYTFRERVLDTPLRNAIIKEILRLISLKDNHDKSWFPNWNIARAIYQKTTATSPLRRLSVDILVSNGEPQWLDLVREEGYQEILVDVVKEFSQKAMDKQNSKDFRNVALKAENYFV